MSDLQSRLSAEVAELSSVTESLIRTAGEEGRDLQPAEQEMVTRNNARMAELDSQIGTIAASQAARAQSLESLARLGTPTPTPGDEKTEYTAGGIVADMWRAGAGSLDAQNNLKRYMSRVAAHVTTTDNPGVIPAPILAPVLDFIDAQRPIVGALGVRALPGGPTFYRPRVKTHTQVGKQAAEKDELVSRKLEIEKLPVTVDTYGGYVNVSRQLIDWSSPDAMQIIVNDLAGQYALETEKALAGLLGGTAGGGTIPKTAKPEEIAGQVYAALAKAMGATGGQGRPVLIAAPDIVGVIAPAFAPYFPQNAFGVGFSAGQAGQQGVIGTISGVPVVMSSQLGAGKAAVLSTAAVEVYEQRIGTLQVTEPSVLGVQVAYAGYFAPVVLVPAGVQTITIAAT